MRLFFTTLVLIGALLVSGGQAHAANPIKVSSDTQRPTVLYSDLGRKAIALADIGNNAVPSLAYAARHIGGGQTYTAIPQCIYYEGGYCMAVKFVVEGITVVEAGDDLIITSFGEWTTEKLSSNPPTPPKPPVQTTR